MVEVLVASGLFGLVMTGLLFSYKTQIQGGLRYLGFSVHQRQLSVALNQMQGASTKSLPEAVFVGPSTLAIQPLSRIRPDGQVEWENRLFLFWLSDNKIISRTFSENDLSKFGITANPLTPVLLSEPLLEDMKSEGGRLLAEGLQSFSASFRGSSKFPEVSASLKRPNGEIFQSSVRLGGGL